MRRWPWQSTAEPSPVLVRDARHGDMASVLDFGRRQPGEAARLGEHAEAMLTSPQLRDQLLCGSTPEGLQGLCWTGGNMVPPGIGTSLMPEVAAEVRRRNRRYSSIAGPGREVLAMWD